MVRPYVVRFVSARSSVGKTYVASNVIARLKARGYIVGVVKHCAHGIDIEDRDSHRYILSGADVVIASSRGIGIEYYRTWVDSVDHALKYIDTPIVVVEGFKESDVGEAVVVARDVEEIKTRSADIVGKVIAYIVGLKTDSDTEYRGAPIYTFNDIDGLANLIEGRALNFICQQLPNANCGYCGYGSCRLLAEAYAKGLTRWCPRDSDVQLVVDGKKVDLNPFVKSLLRSLVIGFTDVLKGVPRSRKRIVIEVSV